MSSIRRVSAIAALCAALLPAAAAAEDPPLYDVDLILFRYTKTAHFKAETWPRDWQTPATQEAVILSQARSRPSGFRPLPASQGPLAGTAKKLRASSRYEILKHLRWRQPGLSREKARPIRIVAGETFTLPDTRQWLAGETGRARRAELDGTVTLVMSRFLHLHTDLLFRQPVRLEPIEAADPEQKPQRDRPRDALGDPAADSSAAAGEPDDPLEAAAARTYELLPVSAGSADAIHGVRIRDQRRMRSGEYHHIDHPLVGVVVVAKPVKQADAP